MHEKLYGRPKRDLHKRAGLNAKELTVPEIKVSGLGGYTRNAGYKTGFITTYEFKTKTVSYYPYSSTQQTSRKQMYSTTRL